MNEPICRLCDKRGYGVSFPMFPKSEGYKFGDICDKCDDAEVDDTALAYHLAEDGSAF